MNVRSTVLFLITCLRCKPYFYIITALTLIIPIHSIAESSSTPHQITTGTSPRPPTYNAPEQLKPQPKILTDIKALIQKQQLNQAKTLAINYLKSNPDDVDVTLLLGIIYYKQTNYRQAELSFQQVLQKVPDYLDAKIGLARVMIVEKKYKKASVLIKEAIKQEPQNPDLKAIKISYKKAIQRKQQKMAKKAIKKAKEQTNYIDAELSKNVNHAMRMINDALQSHPSDERLLTQKANAYYKLHLYPQSAQYAQKALAINPAYGPAKETLSFINEISPNKLWGRNEVSLYSLNEYVSDLHQNWDYSTLRLSRDLALGNLSARLNYANRQRIGSYQGEFELVSILNPYVNLGLYFSFANQPALFPKDAFAAEGYGTIPKFFTLSLGQFYAHILGIIGYKKTTGSISQEIGNNWVSFRVNHYTPNRGQNSTLYLATLRHYFNNYDFYLGITAGYGNSPDLADLLTTNFIVIRNRFISANLRFPIFNHQMLIDIGADHQNWTYPKGLDRLLTGGTIGLSYRF